MKKVPVTIEGTSLNFIRKLNYTFVSIEKRYVTIFLNSDIDIWRIIFLFNPKMQHKRCERFLTEQSVSGRLPDTIWKFSVLLSIAPRLRKKKGLPQCKQSRRDPKRGAGVGILRLEILLTWKGHVDPWALLGSRSLMHRGKENLTFCDSERRRWECSIKSPYIYNWGGDCGRTEGALPL